jgi:two-component system sensor histidine kinase RegB
VEIEWLIRLRWLAVLGQLALILVAEGLLASALPLPTLLLVIAVVAVSNAVLWRYRSGVSRKLVGVVVLSDVIALTLLLALTGGAHNPFSLLYIVHVAIAAVLLGERWTWGVALASTALYGVLFFFKADIPELSHHATPMSLEPGHASHHDMGQNAFSLHLQGMWIAFALVAGVIASFFTRLLKSLKLREEALRSSELSLVKYEKLSLVTTLAANAAHELNTPLATIGIAAGEIVAGLDASASVRRDAELITQEVTRCTGILERLRLSAGDVEGEVPQELPAQDLIEELSSRLPSEQRSRLSLARESEDLSLCVPRRPLIEAVFALVRNALEASPHGAVVVSCARKGPQQWLSIRDEGPGIPPSHLAKLGEPFFTTKKVGAGLGLGVFLARAFADRMKGSLTFSSVEGQGTTAFLSLPVVQ